MSHNFTPGEVAVRISYRGRREFTLLVPGCAGHDGRGRNQPHWHHATGGFDLYTGSLSPLGTHYEKAVALDPGSDRDRERFGRVLSTVGHFGGYGVASVEAALQALVSPGGEGRCESKVRVLGEAVQCIESVGHSGDHQADHMTWPRGES